MVGFTCWWISLPVIPPVLSCIIVSNAILTNQSRFAFFGPTGASLTCCVDVGPGSEWSTRFKINTPTPSWCLYWGRWGGWLWLPLTWVAFCNNAKSYRLDFQLVLQLNRNQSCTSFNIATFWTYAKPPGNPVSAIGLIILKRAKNIPLSGVNPEDCPNFYWTLLCPKLHSNQDKIDKTFHKGTTSVLNMCVF